ncbi:hypothetical protein DICSQDRAFT_85407 [Dichomitus squalens LYAD-421 SS1]|uniref:Essential protein Yae1 N-terminal domain-containing protein n=1 Tax=Dichomitus squalens (strain LYAD-421) TaxID=732165 RepID=R7T1R9_DICSQ|nr:uncharacterized protein DICSQDRAFT_85407 [Dichomitus squalens LYAD-421 SS1]EJF61905.1 hypothetical protein DICSQDRAFT_85407 [Dichomitus squalens LYAD-421 SS1]
MDFDLEDLVNVEQTFYEDGYKDGFAHGRIHGLIEGRALGREKGFEMWEELGFYEGFALMWKAILDAQGAQDERAQNHIRHLLELIQKFPRVNPSTAVAENEAAGSSSELDIPRLFRQIRSRYKVFCAALGIRPTLRAADNPSSPPDRDAMHDDLSGMDIEPTPSSTGRAKSERRKVWALHNPRADNAQSGGTELNF